jgi:MYXO-CTERM domain-containing protein
VVHDEVGRRVWVVNPDDDSVVAIDADTLAVLLRAEVGDRPRSVSLAPDGTIWVACQGSDEIVVLHDDGARAATIPLPWGSGPFGVAFSPDSGAAWVSLESRGALAEIDPVTRAVVRSVEAAPGVRSIALHGDRALAARFLSPADHGEVYDISTKDGALVRALHLAADPGPDETTKGRGVPNALGALAVSPDGVRAFVPAKKDNTLRGLARDGQKLNTDNTVRTIVAFLDLEEGAEIASLRVDLDNHDMASAVEPSPVGDLVFVASQGTNHVDVLDAYTGKLVSGFATGQAPQGLALAPEGKLFVQSFLSRSLDVYDVSGILAGTDAAATRLSTVTTVTAEPLSPEILLGKQIFYNASDPRMSLDGYLSCATCHPDDGQDGRTWDFTDRGEGLRNTTTLVGRAGMGHGPVHWTGNFDEIQDFENDIRHSFGGGGFLSDADFLAGDRNKPLGDRKAELSEPLDALAAYVATLDTFPRSPHRAPDGSLTAEAEAGREVFVRLDCLDCHSGQKLTDSAPGKLHDVGTIKATSGKRLGEALPGIDTPTLRGVWATAPYLHDGSAATLHDVLANPKHGNAAGLSKTDAENLVQFLLQLENEELDLTRPEEGCGCRVDPGSSPARGLPALVLAALIALRRRRTASLG